MSDHRRTTTTREDLAKAARSLLCMRAIVDNAEADVRPMLTLEFLEALVLMAEGVIAYAEQVAPTEDEVLAAAHAYGKFRGDTSSAVRVAVTLALFDASERYALSLRTPLLAQATP